jgi:hypothetical protein
LQFISPNGWRANFFLDKADSAQYKVAQISSAGPVSGGRVLVANSKRGVSINSAYRLGGEGVSEHHVTLEVGSLSTANAGEASAGAALQATRAKAGFTPYACPGVLFGGEIAPNAQER